MKIQAIRRLVPLVMLMVFMNGCDEESAVNSSARFVHLATDLNNLTLVTPERVPMDPAASFDCRAPYVPVDADAAGNIRKNHSRLVSTHHAEIQVYVTSPAREAMKQPSAVFPLGTVILKQKFPKPDSENAQLFTGMLKRETGFNPGCGDWEFFTLTGDGRKVTSRGRIESCMDCHKEFSKTGFVSRKYP